MIALDATVIVRCLTQDDPAMVPEAQALLDHASGAFIAKTVMMDAERLLRTAYRLERGKIYTAMLSLCGLPQVRLEQPAQVAQALADYAAGLDFGTALHLAASEADEGLYTFDASLAHTAQALGGVIKLVAMPGKEEQ